MTQTILVTGGAGFVGRSISGLLLGHSCRVRTVDLEPLEGSSRVEHLQGDIRDAALMRRALEGADAVVHAAAALPLWNPREIHSVNVEGTSVVLQASAAVGIRRVVHISTTAVYGMPGRGPLVETDPLQATDAYSRRSKIAAEELARSFRDRLCVPILRAKLVVGPGRLGIFDVIFDWARRGKHIPILGPGNNPYQMLHVEDLSAAIRLAATLPPDIAGDTFNVAAERFGTVKEDLQAVLDHAGWRSSGGRRG